MADVTPLGTSGYSNTAQAVVPAQPAAPSNLVAANGANQGNQRRVVLTWTDNANNETGFTVQRATDAGVHDRCRQHQRRRQRADRDHLGTRREHRLLLPHPREQRSDRLVRLDRRDPVPDRHQSVIPTTIFPTPATGRRRGNHARPRAVGATIRLDRGRGHGPVRRHAHPASRPVRLPLRVLLIGAIASGLVFATAPLSAPEARAAVPSVVIIVGPAGRATDRYRADGNEAAKVARAAGADVTTIYSPDATWPRVKAALQGASIVVYMGHGNGFPSRYGPVLNKETKDGLGLNPVAGVDDVAHQYFGEAYLTRHIRLAPHAVVLLHHLCYASGNSEPGLAEGTLETGEAVESTTWPPAGSTPVPRPSWPRPTAIRRTT